MKQPISLVTGGAGFIGSHVARHLIESNHQVVILDDLSGGNEENIPNNAIFEQGDICDTARVDQLFNQYQFDYVFHLAAYAAEGLSHFIRRFNYQNNLIGSINLMNESVKHNIKCFVFTSSIAVYGANQVPMSEEMTPQPEDPYGIAKYAVELDLKACHEMFGLNYLIFRPHNVYGEHQNIGDKYRNVVGIFMNQLMQHQPLTIFGDGSQTRAFSYIDDVAPYIAKSIEVKAAMNQTFNIGGDQVHTVNELANQVMKAMDVHQPIEYLPARNEVDHAYANHEKAKQCFNIKTNTPLNEGIAKMANWAKNVGSKSSKTFTAIEIEENLPSIWSN